MKRRISSLLLSAAMAVSLLPMLAISASAMPKNVTVVNIPEWIRSLPMPTTPHEGLIAVCTKESLSEVGYVDYKGNLVIPRIFTSGRDFENGLAIVSVARKYGVINKSGQLVVPAIYAGAGEHIYHGLLKVQGENGKWGMVNTSGTEVIPLIYDELEEDYFEDGRMVAKLNGRYGVIDKSNNIILPFLYTMIDYGGVNRRPAAKMVVENGKTVERWGVIDFAGNQLVPFAYEETALSGVSEVVKVKKNGGWGVLDVASGKEIVPTIYEEIGSFETGPALILKDKKYGYVNRYGVVIAEPQYADIGRDLEWGYAGEFRDGYALVAKRAAGQVDGGWIYIDVNGKPINDVVYAAANPFYEGIATARTQPSSYEGGSAGAINTKGEVIIPHQYLFLQNFYFGRAVYSPYSKDREAHWTSGVLDTTGKIIIPAQFYEASGYGNYEEGDSDAYMSATYNSTAWGGDSTAKFQTYDLWGKVVKPYGFSNVGNFVNGVASAYNAVSSGMPVAWIINNDYKPTAISDKNSSVTFPCNKSSILVNGTAVSFEGYTLASSNYFKLRDLAMALNGTTAQFNVKWDGAKGAVNIIPGEAYVPAGGEMAAGDGTGKSVAPSAATTYISGRDSGLMPVAIAGNNYYMLRDIMEKLGVTVGWDGAANTITLTTKTAEQAAADGQIVTGAVTDGVYTIKAAKNNAIGFSVSGASTEAGGKIKLYTTSDESHYSFNIKSLGDNKYTISPVSSGLMVTSPRKQGEGLTQETADNGAAQTFTITYQEDGTYRIQDCDGLYCAASAGKVENNSAIILWTKTDEVGQQFVLEKKAS